MDQQQTLETIIKEITNVIGKIIGTRVYAAIVNPNGIILALQDRMESFKDMIETFVKMNFSYLEYGNHSIPLSGYCLAFFRTKNGMIAIYSPKGRHGQLLSFKGRFSDFSPRIDELIGDVPYDQELVVKSIIEKMPPKLKYSRNRWNIIPIFSINITGKEKLQIDEATLLNKCDGQATIGEISGDNQLNLIKTITILTKYYNMGWIKFPNFYQVKVNCPICKAKRFIFIPKKAFKNNPSEYIRMEIPPGRCDHSFVIFIDENLKITTRSIEFFTKITDQIDFFGLSIKSLLHFFGQDLFSNIFHTLLFKKGVLIIDKTDYIEDIGEYFAKYLKIIFPNLEYGTDIRAISPEDHKKDWKKFKDWLIVDLASNIVLNEPFEKEEFDVIAEILNEILKEENEQKQVLKLNQEFERLLLLTEPVINKVERLKKVIVEGDLIEQIREDYDLELRIQEIPLIKKLAKAYYNVDISQKILSELAYSLW